MVDLIMQFIQEYSVEALAIWGSIITIASIIIKITPSKADDAAFGIIMKILNALALNPNKDKIKQEVEKEIRERDNDSTRSNLTDALR